MKKITLLLFFVIFALFSQNAYSQIWVNPITSGRPISSHYLGDKLSADLYFQFEIGQTTWNASEVGIGQNSDGTTGWNWAAANFYANGSGNNKQVQRNIGNFQFVNTGTWYVVGRAKANSGDAFTYGDDGGWSNTTVLTASTSTGSCPYFAVSALSDPTSQTSTAYSISQINLSWAKWNSKSVMIVRRLTSAAASNAPTQGTSYSVGNSLGTGTVVYNGGGTSFNDTGLTPGTSYTYTFYSENYSYYSTGATAEASTTTQTTAANDYFRSKATGNWNTAGTWESSPNNTNWITSTLVPDASAAAITILSGHNVTLDTNATISGLVINSGGTFTASDATPKTLTIAKSTSGTTLANSGTWANGSGSTVVFSGAPSGVDAVHTTTGTIAFQNVTINKTGGSSNVGASFGSGSTISGTLEIGSGGFISTAPPTSFYGANAILKFNQGSEATYNVNSGDYSWSTTEIPQNITVTSGTVNLNANRTASGNLLIDGGALVLNTGNPNLTINGNWTRSSGSFTANTGTITLSGSTNGTVNVTGGATMSNLVVSKTASAKAIINCNLTTSTLTINSAAILEANPAKQLTINTSLVNDGTLTLKSAENVGTATIKTPVTITGSGTTNVEQFVSSLTTGLTGRNWYISSPISAASVITITTETGNDLVYRNGSVWSNASGTMEVMKGYIAKSPNGSKTIKFTGGSLNTGNQSVADLPSGFNLVGNPYASFVDFSQATKTGVTNSIWYRSKSSGSYVFQTYNVSSNIGANDGSAIIPPLQSFWIKTTSGTNTFGFTNTMRSHQDQSIATNRLKAPAVSTQKMLRLEIANGTDKDETVVYFNENALNTFDEYDSQKMFNETAGVPEIYTFTDSKNLVINGFNAIQLNAEIPLGFRTGLTEPTNLYTLKATQLQNFGADTELVLIDKDISNSETIMTEGSEYTFNSAAVNTTNRFSIVFRAKGTTTGGICNPNEYKDILVYRNANNQICIDLKSELNKIENIAVYNTMGQKITETKPSKVNTIINVAFETGVYFVKLNIDNKTITRKVIIK